jgi:7-methyl-GTP pyrophosphatase
VLVPDVDEKPCAGEAVVDQVRRLALCKARAVAHEQTDALIIGSDQLATCAGTVFGKPGSHHAATAQLAQMRGQTLVFQTGLCLFNCKNGAPRLDCVAYKVHFRDYSDAEIERYLLAETPYDCAGSFKSEQLGISLIASMEGPDPTALVGLPLISLAAMLRQEGLFVP